MLKYLLKVYLIENVIDEFQYINIDTIENDVDEIIDEIHNQFLSAEIEIDDAEIIELFDLRNELKLILINEIDIHDKIYLINEYIDDYYIIENNNDIFQDLFNKKIDIDEFHYYNKDHDLILYKSFLDKYTTINYIDVAEYFHIDDIINTIFNNII